MSIQKNAERTGAVALIISFLLLVGCGSEGRLTPVDVGNREQILHINTGAEVQELDPHVVTGVPENRVLNALFVGLIIKNGVTLKPEPGVAESWTISKDLKIYTFKLRDNANWSNGDPVTAMDFVFSWKRLLSPALASEYANSLYYVRNAEDYNLGKVKDFNQVGIKALDNKTFRVELHSPTPYFLQVLDHYSTYPVHPATIEAFKATSTRGTPWTRPKNMVSNGPFTLTEWKTNKHIRVDKDPSFWGSDRYPLKTIYFYPVEQVTVEERMFRAGQLHITNSIPNEKIPVYQKKKPEVIRIEPYMGTYYYELNVRRPPLDNVLVRLALAKSINRGQLAGIVLKGGEIPSPHLIPHPKMFGYKNVDSPLHFNPDEAKQLLKKAGYPNGKGFPTLTILYNTFETHRLIAATIQAMWKETLNINVELSNQEWKVYIDSRNNGDYDIARAGWIGDYPDINTFADLMLTHNGNNRTGWSNKKYDSLIFKANTQIDAKRRDAIMQEAETLMLNNVPIVPIYSYTSKKLVKTSVKNWPKNVMDYFNHYRDVYLQADGADAKPASAGTGAKNSSPDPQ